MKCCSRTESETNSDRETMLVRDSRLPVIWVFGGPCAGKSSMCQRITEKYNLMHIDCDNVICFESMTQSSRGIQISAQLNRRELVPDEVLVNILKEIMPRNVKITDGYLLDNFPNSVNQGRLFEKKICPVTALLYLKTSEANMTLRFKEQHRKEKPRGSDGRSSRTLHDVPLKSDRVEVQIRNFEATKTVVLREYERVLHILNAEKSRDQVNRMVEKILKKLCVDASVAFPMVSADLKNSKFTSKFPKSTKTDEPKDGESQVSKRKFGKLRNFMRSKKKDTVKKEEKNDNAEEQQKTGETNFTSAEENSTISETDETEQTGNKDKLNDAIK